MKKRKKQLNHEIVAEEVKRYIKVNALKKGESLPSIADLATEFSVSRTSIREGLRVLEALHVVEIVNGKGVLVKDVEGHRIQTRITIKDKKHILLDLCDVRRGLEGRAAELAAELATEAQLQKMSKHLAVFEKLRTLNEDTAEADLLFHRTLYEASHNLILCQIINSVYDSFYESWHFPFDLATIFEDTYHLHEELFCAVKEKKPKEAREKVNQLIDVVESAIRQLL